MCRLCLNEFPNETQKSFKESTDDIRKHWNNNIHPQEHCDTVTPHQAPTNTQSTITSAALLQHHNIWCLLLRSCCSVVTVWWPLVDITNMRTILKSHNTLFPISVSLDAVTLSQPKHDKVIFVPKHNHTAKLNHVSTETTTTHAVVWLCKTFRSYW